MLSSNVHFLAANNYFKNSEFKKSFISLITISNQFSKDPGYLRLLAEVQNKLNDQKARLKTLKALSVASKLADDQISYMHGLMDHSLRNESLDEAFKLLATDLTEQQKIVVLKNLIQIYTKENDFEGLSEVCQQLQDMSIVDSQLDYSLALLSAAQGDLDQAINFIRQAVTLNPTFDTGWTALGLYHYKKGDIELAKANLEKALDLNPAQTTALKYISSWVDTNSTEQMDATLQKVNYYLQEYNFDEEISGCYAQLLAKKGHSEYARLETEKLSYYFGK